MNRAERRARGITKEVSAGIEEAEKIRTVNQYSVAVASVLWDLNKDPDEIRSTMAKIWDRFDSFKRNVFRECVCRKHSVWRQCWLHERRRYF